MRNKVKSGLLKTIEDRLAARPVRRLTASIAMLQLLLALSLFGIIIYAGLSMNRSSRNSEMSLLNNALSHAVLTAINEQKSAALWDEAVIALTPGKQNATWLEVEIGRFLYNTYGHQRNFIVGPDNKIAYAYDHGKSVDVASFRKYLQVVEGLVADVRRRKLSRYLPYDGANLRLHQRREFLQNTSNERWGGNILTYENRTIIAVASLIVPTEDLSLATESPFILVSIINVDQSLVNNIAEKLQLAELTILPLSAQTASNAEQVLVPDNGQPTSKLTWITPKPGKLLLTLVLPIVAVALFAAAFTTVMLLKRLRRATTDLADREARALHEALHDSLSGLPNRRSFTKSIEDKIALCRQDNKRLVVAYIDIDHFKSINDTLGHRMGDKLISAVGMRLKLSMRPGDILARFGGDEFAAMRVLENTEQAAVFGKDLSRAFALPVDLFGQSLRVTGSIGLAEIDNFDLTISDIMRHADIALYQAKYAGRARFVQFNDSMAHSIEERRTIEMELQKAIQESSLTMVYQPLIDCASNKIRGVEALVRWNHPMRGSISPGVFIPIAEETGLMPQLGEVILDKVFADAVNWPGLEVAVNLSPAQIRHLNLVPYLRKLLDCYQLDAGRIVLEITEGVLLEQTETTASTLAQIVDMGFKLALDDFGTGYSSLSYLRHFRFDKIKIDQSFVHGATEESHAIKIVRAVTDLGKSLGMSVVAEGIENEDEAQLMINAGCNELQGYYFSRPVAVAAIDAFFAVPAHEQDLDVRRIGRA
jgi:diguanylate cyclase (GGDEF)-like protein